MKGESYEQILSSVWQARFRALSRLLQPHQQFFPIAPPSWLHNQGLKKLETASSGSLQLEQVTPILANDPQGEHYRELLGRVSSSVKCYKWKEVSLSPRRCHVCTCAGPSGSSGPEIPPAKAEAGTS